MQQQMQQTDEPQCDQGKRVCRLSLLFCLSSIRKKKNWEQRDFFI